MSEQNEATTGQETTEKKEKVNHGPFKTLEEAQQHKPKDAKWKLFRVVAPDGSVSFAWTFWANTAIELAAKAAGWSATEHGKTPNKEKVGDLLAQLTPEDRAVLIAQYVPPSKGRK